MCVISSVTGGDNRLASGDISGHGDAATKCLCYCVIVHGWWFIIIIIGDIDDRGVIVYGLWVFVSPRHCPWMVVRPHYHAVMRGEVIPDGVSWYWRVLRSLFEV